MSNKDIPFGRYSNSLLTIVNGKGLYEGDSDKAFQEITEAAAGTLELERASIWVFSEDQSAIHCVDLYEKEKNRHSEGMELKKADFPAYFEALGGHRAIDAHDAHLDPRTCEFSQSYLTPLGISSMLDAPIRIAGTNFGVICLEHIGQKRQWSSEEIIYAGSLANLVSHAVDARKRKIAEDALKESEQRFRDFAESSSDWRWEMDADLRFTFMSEHIRSVGVEPEDIYGKTRMETLGGNTSDENLKAHLQILENRLPFRDFEIQRDLDGKKPFWTRTSGVPIFDKDNNFVGYRGTATNISEQKELEVARDDALAAAEKANQVKSEFLATMSHEFRTPLNAILGFSEILKAEYFGPLGSESYLEYAKDIHTSGRLMLDLVNDLLDIAAIEAGKRSIDKEPINIEELVRACIKNVEQIANDKMIVRATGIPENLPMLYADKRSVTQIMLNLLSNAVKFTDPHGSITVSAEVADESINLVVSDTGRGIPADKLSTITEPFTQSNPEITQSLRGTGLGLTIVAALVSLHDGILDIDSTLGQGTTVTVVLPRHDIEQVESPDT